MALDLPRPYHLNVNCSDLERSRRFYCDLLGLSGLARTTPAQPQPGAAFGLDQVQWDAWILAGDLGIEGIVLDLLEWKVPAPAGRPATLTEQGFAVVGIGVPDLDDTIAALDAAGYPPRGPVLARPGGPRVAMVDDPDGTLVELIELDQRRLTHVVVNVADLDASRAWYERVLGASGAVVGPTTTSGALHGVDEMTSRTCYLPIPGAPFQIALREWTVPAPRSRTPRRANELGIFRHALFTDDIDADHGHLVELGVGCYSPPVALDMGPGLPDDLRALFFDDPDGACLELIQPPTT